LLSITERIKKYLMKDLHQNIIFKESKEDLNMDNADLLYIFRETRPKIY